MIIVSIGGGLGNQMFEYAFYEMLKKRFPKQQIKLDIMHTFGYAHNGYELDEIFGLHADDCNLLELKRLSSIYPLDASNYKLGSFFWRIKKKICGDKKTCIMQEDFSVFDSKFLELEEDKSYYLYGVFANYRYFEPIQEHIKKIYSFPEIKDDKNKMYEKSIQETNSVSVHIRHGDYVDWGIEILSENYYRNAMRFMESRVGKCRYYVFTDDPDYVKETYADVDDLIVIEGNAGKKSFIDMQLMSMCKHNIIANSSFSFWGAYLNKNRDKIVIAPDLPYTGCKNAFTCDDWTTISHK